MRASAFDNPPSGPDKRTVERLFDESSGAYDRVGPSVFGRFGARLVELVPLFAGARVLDVATGTGAALLPAARAVGSAGWATGIDLSAGMLREAERAVRASCFPNVELRRMDAELLDFPDRTFDAVLCAHAVFVFGKPGLLLEEMRRVTKDGGCVAISCFGGSPPAFMPAWSMICHQLAAYRVGVWVPNPLASYTSKQMEELLAGAGFRSVKVRCETSDLLYPHAEEWWEFLLTMPSRRAILAMDEPTRSRFKDEYLARLGPLFQDDGLHLSVSMLYATARP